MQIFSERTIMMSKLLFYKREMLLVLYSTVKVFKFRQVQSSSFFWTLKTLSQWVSITLFGSLFQSMLLEIQLLSVLHKCPSQGGFVNTRVDLQCSPYQEVTSKIYMYHLKQPFLPPASYPHSTILLRPGKCASGANFLP